MTLPGPWRETWAISTPPSRTSAAEFDVHPKVQAVYNEELQERLAYFEKEGKLLEAQRQAIVRLRNQGVISSDVMHRIERELDLEDTRLEI